MLYREITAVCSEIHTKHINTVCGQNAKLLNVKLAVHIDVLGFKRLKTATVLHACTLTAATLSSFFEGQTIYSKGFASYVRQELSRM
jgi:hypothetical protein